MNIKKIQGFTLIELMVAIAVSTIVVSAFFKMYDTASRVERATFQRSSAYVIGDRMVNVIADSMRMIGFNKAEFDPIAQGPILATSSSVSNSNKTEIAFKSPYGSVVSKLAEAATGSGGACVLKVISEQLGGYDSINRIIAHTKSGLREGEVTAFSGNQITANFSEISDCGEELPAGTVVSGADMCVRLNVDTSKDKVELFAEPMDDGDDCLPGAGVLGCGNSTKCLYMHDVSGNTSITRMISVKKFVIEYLIEDSGDPSDITREWQLNPTIGVGTKSVLAVRFGVILADPRPRFAGSTEKITGDEIKYCVFPASSSKDSFYCYKNTNLNESVFVFRRTVFLRNENYLYREWMGE